MARLTVVRDKTEVPAQAAERITSLIEGAIVIRDAAAISLAGGRTPGPLYECLADPDRPWRARIDWTRVHLFWSDERNVPPDHPDSNFGLANRTLIQHVPLRASHIHRMRGELPAVDAAREYDALLRSRRDGNPGALFDVMLLGVGADAHIASMFPGSPLLTRDAMPCTGDETEPRKEELAAGIWVRQLNQWRITLTPPALLDAIAVIVLAAGSTKADAVAAAIEGELDVARCPAQLLGDAGDRVEWIIDEPAAAQLRRNSQ
jgi:6-phosphogluconolactonase